jgi:hypothetical protein
MGQRRKQRPFGSPDPWKGHISLNTCLLVSTQKVDEDRVVARSIWSLDQEVTVMQRFEDYSKTVHGLEHRTVQRLRQGPRLWVVFQNIDCV